MGKQKTIGELIEEMRIKAGAQEYAGHSFMDLERFADDTRHMIIFDVLTHDSPIGWKGNAHAPISRRRDTAGLWKIRRKGISKSSAMPALTTGTSTMTGKKRRGEYEKRKEGGGHCRKKLKTGQ